MSKKARIFVAGHRGLVGSAIVRRLQGNDDVELVLRDRQTLDLVDQHAVSGFFAETRPKYVYLAAARVGGIRANDAYPAEFLRDNLMIQNNVIDAAYRSGVNKLLFLGSSCVYPKFARQPMREDCLLTGSLEPTNEWYAIAKIAGLKMCQAYRRQYGFNAIVAMPTNLYGPGDNFNLADAHVLPALIRKFHEAKQTQASKVEIWGTGTPRRELMHIDDLAAALVYLMDRYDDESPINVGWGVDVSISELAEMVARVVGFGGELRFDPKKPDGTPRKLLDTTRLKALRWEPRIPLEEGIRSTYKWFCDHVAEIRS